MNIKPGAQNVHIAPKFSEEEAFVVGLDYKVDEDTLKVLGLLYLLELQKRKMRQIPVLDHPGAAQLYDNPQNFKITIGE